MKCIEIATPAGLDNLRWVERPIQRPAADEIVVRVRASSLNFHDALVVRGVLPSAEGRIPLSDCAGEVVETGAAVNAFKTGDRVLGTFFQHWHSGPATAKAVSSMRGEHVDGFASEYVTLPASQFTRAPAHLSDAQACTLPCAALTAWRALMVEGALKPGDTVLVKGTGGVALFAAQFALMAGARVIALTSSAAKVAKLQALGVQHVFDYQQVPRWADEVRQLCDGEGVDHVVEVVGGDLTQTLQAMRVNAHLAIVGALSRQPMQFSTLPAVLGNLRFSAITVGSREHQVEMVEAVERAKLEPVIDRRYPLANLADAFRYMETQQHFGKIVITY
ncbi:NAD(P)-dependent alcohol dehydrogenase [Pseudomonas putida]|uniref:zinc-dependent alcohol dehydrogenase family protein n=1 Tax=Pseudomonas putida TaxID=303 RepID=UPI00236448F3|nr:NAD(P)-dependent alcohol dehydrogenase [Pseudomonas putida]MDD2068700.1 NAD(P)-dependent alcohol dehydrogenase [Pseudomonas putida]HDS1738633.1 NAD(P)-dependent alcohol dehydrogenase [Pseudomonas putida]